MYSVIIPTYHRNDLLAKCLDCLAPGVQTLPAQQYEVIVTDDGSQTTAKEMIRQQYPWAKWVAGSRKGPAANRNNGARYATGEWLAFTDDDCLADPQWLEAYAEAIIKEVSYFVFEGRVYVDRPRQTLAEKSPANELGGYLWSCNFAIKKQLFDYLTGFDERFPYAAMEDVDLKLRLTKAGYKILFIKTASLCHPWRNIRGWKEFKQHQKSTFIYLSIHPDESHRINSVYYLRCLLTSFVKSTLPGILKFSGRGLWLACLEHIAFLQMVILLLRKKKISIYEFFEDMK
ncbi:glycosyltransferase family 2 protein [Nostoc sp.]|uniref:glycosyltransferase family 2 protein n=1 Tax=Nostoc sp. TaxID=1180 RepID=UPI002FFBD6EE